MKYYSSDGTYKRESGTIPYVFTFEAGKEYDIIPGIQDNKVRYHLRQSGKIKETYIPGNVKIEALPEDKPIDMYIEKLPTDRKYEVIQTIQPTEWRSDI